jgi:HEXXH motif-containing protein
MSDPQIPPLVLSKSQIADLAAGLGDAATIEVLREAQHSKVLQTLASIVDLSDSTNTKPALDLLDAAQEANEQACYDAFTYPHIAVWAWVCLQEQMGITARESSINHAEYLSCVAASVAHQSGVKNFQIEVPLHHGGVMLPGLGRAILAASHVNGTATISAVEGELSITFDGHKVVVPARQAGECIEWQAVRTVSVSCDDLQLSVAIDDVDPYRFYYATSAIAEPADRLDDVGIKAWDEELHAAWELLVRHHRKYAVGIAAGLRTIVPMAETVHNNHDRMSESFGVVALAAVSKRWTAYAILEEFQRSKLAALNYLFPIHKVTHEVNSYCLVWVQEPCSFRVLVEYTYALPAIIEFWNTQASSAALAEDRVLAATIALRWLARSDALRQSVINSQELTPFGLQIFENATSSGSAEQSAFYADQSAHVRELARFTERDNRVCWRLHNLKPNAQVAGRLAGLWISGGPCPSSPVAVEVNPGPPMVSWLGRRWAAIVKLTDAQLFSDLKANIALARSLYPTVSLADLALIDGEREEAIETYLGLINDDCHDLDAWAGLAVSCEMNHTLAGQVLGRFPETVRGVYVRIIETWQHPPDLLEVAAWLAPALLTQDPNLFLATTP